MKVHNHCNLRGEKENGRPTEVSLVLEDDEANGGCDALAQQTRASVNWNFSMWDLYTAPLVPSPLLRPLSLLSTPDALNLPWFWESGAVGWAMVEVWVFFLAVMWVSVNESKDNVSQTEAPCPRTRQPSCISKTPRGLLIGGRCLQQDMFPI